MSLLQSSFLEQSEFRVNAVTASCFYFVLDCMKPLIRSEDFYLRNIQGTSGYGEAFRSRHRIALDDEPWCLDWGFGPGEWAQVDLGKMLQSLRSATFLFGVKRQS